MGRVGQEGDVFQPRFSSSWPLIIMILLFIPNACAHRGTLNVIAPDATFQGSRLGTITHHTPTSPTPHIPQAVQGLAVESLSHVRSIVNQWTGALLLPVKRRSTSTKDATGCFVATVRYARMQGAPRARAVRPTASPAVQRNGTTGKNPRDTHRRHAPAARP